MERIRQAVEQAKRDRQKAGGDSGPRRFPSGIGTVVVAPGLSPGSFEYDQTKCIEVSAEVRNNNRLVAGIKDHPLRDIYKMLRTRVIQEMKANSWNAIAVTSPATGAGKTHTAINLSIAIAGDLSHTALLIDGDLRRPSVHKYFGYEPEYGLSDHLFDNVPLSKILFHPDMDRLTVLPGNKPIEESAEMLASPKIVSMLGDIRSRYSDRIIVLDLAPVLSVDDALALAPNIDCVLMVAEAGETSRDDLAQALELLDGVPIIGTVLNKVDKKVIASY
jgi:capsular exopolysaccharide synthesis family protein